MKTSAEFWRELRRLKGWEVRPMGVRRLESVFGFALWVCPICAVSNALARTQLTTESNLAAFALGMSEDLRVAIVAAADGDQASVLRKDLLSACRLNGEAT